MELTRWNFDNAEIRTLEIDGEPWFVGKDVATALGYAKPENAIANHVDNEDKTTTLIQGTGSNYKSNAVIINESGVYALIFGSKLPDAQRFKKWVTSEVLPTIRKHGAYMTPDTLQSAIANPDFAIGLLQELKAEQEKRKALEANVSKLSVENQIMQPKAEYFDTLVDRNLLTNFRDTAKELKVKQKEFIDFLLDKKYLYRDTKGKLNPHSRYVGELFEVKEYCNSTTNHVGTQTLVTPKGRETFRLLFEG